MTSPTPMEVALEEARGAAARGEVPVGAVVVHGQDIMSRASNRTIEQNDPTAHAEILVIRDACKILNNQRLTDCDLYVTLEPCAMCAAAIAFARIRRLYIGTEDVKGGGVINGVRYYESPTCHHRPEVYTGICEKESGDLLRRFFRQKRGD